MSDDHVVPQVLGGWLPIPCVCVSCNNKRFGANFEAELKKNGFIVRAIDTLGLQPKALAYKSAKLTMTLDEDKSLAGYFDETNAPKYFPGRISDGSMITPEEQAKFVLQKQIERHERDTGRATTFDLDNFEKLPYDLVIPVYGTDLSFIKRRGRPGSLTISGLDRPISFMVPAKIAFEHLAGLCYQYTFREEFNSIRDWLHHGDDNVNNHVLLISYLRDKSPDELTYQPVHFIRLGYQHECLSAIVGLFGTIIFSVFLAHIPDFSTFPSPEVIGPYHMYDVENRSMYQMSAPQKIDEDDAMYLDVVSQYGRVQTRKN